MWPVVTTCSLQSCLFFLNLLFLVYAFTIFGWHFLYEFSIFGMYLIYCLHISLEIIYYFTCLKLKIILFEYFKKPTLYKAERSRWLEKSLCEMSTLGSRRDYSFALESRFRYSHFNSDSRSFQKNHEGSTIISNICIWMCEISKNISVRKGRLIMWLLQMKTFNLYMRIFFPIFS